MSLERLINPFSWQKYSKKLAKKIENPRSVGQFTREDAEERGMRLAVGAEGKREEGNQITMYWLVDPSDGVIVDAKFHAYGQSALIGAAEAACDLLVGKNYDQAQRLSGDLIDKSVRDASSQASFPLETYPHLNLVLSAIEYAVEQCKGIPLPEKYVAPPMTADLSEIVEGGYPGWEELSEVQKISVIEEVLNRDVRPYIALDAGGVEIKKLDPPFKLLIGYQGTCTSCISSVGATLSYIQQVLKNKVHPQITVIPDDLSF